MFKKLKKNIKETFQTVNQINSSMGVQCVAPETCMLRHTTSCNNCKNNIGKYEDKTFMNHDRFIVLLGEILLWQEQ